MKRHRLDPFSLIFGLVFAGLGAALLDTDVDVSALSGAGWVPVPLVLLGLLLLAVGLNRVGTTEPPAETDADSPGDDSGI